MRRMITQAVVLLAVAGAVGAYFAFTRPPKVGLPADLNSGFAPLPVRESGKAGSPAAEPKAQERVGEKAPTNASTKAPAPAQAAAPAPAPAATAAAPKAAAPATAPAAPKGGASGGGASASSDIMIPLARAKEIYDAQEVGGRGVVFVDARNWAEFSAGHIRGAMWIDKKHFDGAAPRKIREFLPGNAVVVYCHGELCTDSEAVVRRLHALNLGIGPFFILSDGFEAWKRAGYPVDSGSEVGFDVR